MKVSGLIMAADCGEQVGKPKAILQVLGEALALVLARQLKAFGLDPVIIVIGCRQTEVYDRISSWPTIVTDQNWKQGEFSSLQKGLGFIPDDSWAMVLPVDAIAIAKTTLTELSGAMDDRYDAVIPSFEGRWGHPVLLSPDFCLRLKALDVRDQSLEELLRQARARVLSVTDPAVLNEIDSIETFKKMVLGVL